MTSEHSCREPELRVKCCMSNFSKSVYYKVFIWCGHRGFRLAFVNSVYVYVYVCACHIMNRSTGNSNWRRHHELVGSGRVSILLVTDQLGRVGKVGSEIWWVGSCHVTKMDPWTSQGFKVNQQSCIGRHHTILTDVAAYRLGKSIQLQETVATFKLTHVPNIPYSSINHKTSQKGNSGVLRINESWSCYIVLEVFVMFRLLYALFPRLHQLLQFFLWNAFMFVCNIAIKGNV